MIDPHVHLRDWEQKNKETIEHGIRIANSVGFYGFFDMPNTLPPLTSAKLLSKRIEYGKNIAKSIDSNIFYGVYSGVTANTAQIEEVVKFHNEHFPDCIGFKMFAGHSTGNMGITSQEEQYTVFKTLSNMHYNGVLAIHCEMEELLQHEKWNPELPKTHSIARPEIAEIKSIQTQIELALKTNFSGHIHICHISTKTGVEIVNEAKQSGVKISCGATAHHALLNTTGYDKFGIFAKMNPPLRSQIDQEAIFEFLLKGKIDWIESDHAPHTVKDKMAGASGVPGFAGSMILLSNLRKAGCSETKLEKLFGKNCCKVFGISLPVNLPTQQKIEDSLSSIISEYPYNIFEY